MRLPSFVEPAVPGIYTIDTGYVRPKFDASYLLVDQGQAAFIDTGTNYAIPRLLEALAAVGLTPQDVTWVIPTHAHLDHAGGSGLLMQQLPQARLLTHPRAARHLIDPTALWEGALAVYGPEEMERSYGKLIAVPQERVVTSSDGMTVRIGQRQLELIDTPGHARHHHCIWDAASRGWFSGDTFGLSYREFDTARGPWILPTSTPVQFEPEPLKQSVQRMLAREPQHVYLTHFGPVGDVARLGRELCAQIDAMVALGRRAPAGAGRHDWLKEQLAQFMLQGARQHGCTLSEAQMRRLLTMDFELNAQGLAIWLDKSRSGTS
jgi:glyoxylase-like metal-dependent hydrolase (beta-lactamase superfamily II)